MSTLSSTQTPSPSFLSAVFSLIALIVYPLLCLVRVARSLIRGRIAESIVFALIALFGAAMLCLFFLTPGIKDSLFWRPIVAIFYSSGLIVTMGMIRSIKDEEHGTYVR